MESTCEYLKTERGFLKKSVGVANTKKIVRKIHLIKVV